VEYLPDVLGFRDELLEGTRVLSPDVIGQHHLLTMRLERMLSSHYEGSGLVVLRECSFQVVEPNGVASFPKPDIMILSQSQFEDSLINRRPFPGPPEYVIEVISPSELPSARNNKIEICFRLGVRGLVEILMNSGAAIIHRPDGEPEHVVRGHKLNGPFPLDLASLFSGIRLG
jgi:Uma2 family endonuclease